MFADLVPCSALLEAMFKRSSRPVIVKDEQSRFLFLSDQACELLGVTLKEVFGRTDHDFLPKAEADAIRAMDVHIFSMGAEELFEEDITARDGSIRTLVTHKRCIRLPTPDGQCRVLVAEFDDVTELRGAEKVLRASEEHHRSLIELHPQTPWVANAIGEIIEVGHQWAHISGRDLEEASGHGWESSVHPSDVGHVRRNWKEAVQEGTLLDVEFRIRTASGEYRWYRSRAAPKQSPAGEIVRWYGLLEDVHERRCAIDALRESEQNLREHRDKLERLVELRTDEIQRKNVELDRLLQQEREVNALQRRFVAMISHEFRTPLAIIDSAAQRLIRTKLAPTPEYLAEKSMQIKGAVARMVELMESILAAGRLQTGTIEIRKEEASLGALIRECSIRKQQISRSHLIHLDLERLPSTMSFDPGAIERVFSNLLSNAVKYAPTSPDIFVRGWAEDGIATIEVSDSGIGIDAEDLERLFEPYFRARSATGIAGTGIGLNIVREIIELHDGTISVSSEIGRGTTFTVRIPSKVRPTQEEAA
ncbi:PAS domain-containing sensor histidine kinase [Agrobacterium pusense]|uniref:PAS domain-containing sensor histidine kinase n=1 Tax=Agrobacterium pusense TaxID=648995 RepID=UPI003FD60B5A